GREQPGHGRHDVDRLAVGFGERVADGCFEALAPRRLAWSRPLSKSSEHRATIAPFGLRAPATRATSSLRPCLVPKYRAWLVCARRGEASAVPRMETLARRLRAPRLEARDATDLGARRDRGTTRAIEGRHERSMDDTIETEQRGVSEKRLAP